MINVLARAFFGRGSNRPIVRVPVIMRLLRALVAALGIAAVLGTVIARPVFARAGDGCAPVQAGWDGVFVQSVGDTCTASQFIRAEDVQGLVTAGQTPNGYVLVSDVRRDDTGKEALILVKPWGFDRYTVGLNLTKVFCDGPTDLSTHPSATRPTHD